MEDKIKNRQMYFIAFSIMLLIKLYLQTSDIIYNDLGFEKMSEYVLIHLYEVVGMVFCLAALSLDRRYMFGIFSLVVLIPIVMIKIAQMLADGFRYLYDSVSFSSVVFLLFGVIAGINVVLDTFLVSYGVEKKKNQYLTRACKFGYSTTAIFFIATLFEGILINKHPVYIMLNAIYYSIAIFLLSLGINTLSVEETSS